MKTLVLSEIFPPRVGGSGRWLNEIYSRLDNDRYLIATATHEDSVDFDSQSQLQIQRFNLSQSAWGLRSFTGLAAYTASFFRLRKFCRRNDVGMIHCGRSLHEGWLAYLLKRCCGIPYLSFIHGEDVECAAESRELKWMTHQVLKHAELLIANSNFTAGRLSDVWNVRDEQLKTLHPGVDITRFIPEPAKFGQQKSETTLLTVGRLQKRKGHDILIQALPAIRASVPDIRYHIVGGGEEKAELERLAEVNSVTDCVHFFDEVTESALADQYRNCDLFVLPNRQIGGDVEGFGMVLVEAQACGRPVLAGASGGTADTMLRGETGELVLCEDPEVVASAIINLLSDRDRLQRMGAKGRDFVASHFDWEVLAQNARAVFDEVMQKAHQSRS